MAARDVLATVASGRIPQYYEYLRSILDEDKDNSESLSKLSPEAIELLEGCTLGLQSLNDPKVDNAFLKVASSVQDDVTRLIAYTDARDSFDERLVAIDREVHSDFCKDVGQGNLSPGQAIDSLRFWWKSKERASLGANWETDWNRDASVDTVAPFTDLHIRNATVQIRLLVDKIHFKMF